MQPQFFNRKLFVALGSSEINNYKFAQYSKSQ